MQAKSRHTEMAPTATTSSTIFAVGPGTANERDPTKASTYEEREEENFEQKSSKEFTLLLSDNLSVKEASLKSALPAGTTLQILDKAIQGYTAAAAAVAAAAAAANATAAGIANKQTKKKKKSEAPPTTASVYETIKPFLVDNPRGGKLLRLSVVKHHVMPRDVGWTYTYLVPVREKKGAQVVVDDDDDDDDDDLPLLVFNLFEEAYHGTLQNVKTAPAGEKGGKAKGPGGGKGDNNTVKPAAAADAAAKASETSVDDAAKKKDEATAGDGTVVMRGVTDAVLTSSLEEKKKKGKVRGAAATKSEEEEEEDTTPSRGDSLSPTRGIADNNNDDDDDGVTPRRSKRRGSALLFASAHTADKTTKTPAPRRGRLSKKSSN